MVEKEISLVSSRVEQISCAHCCWGSCLSADRRLRKVVVVATSYSSQKKRLEDGGERRRTSNYLMRIPAELRSRNRRKPHFLHWRTTRIQRSRNQGWHLTRPASKRRLQPSICPQKHSQIYPRPGEQQISPTFWALCRVICKEETREASKRRLKQKQTLHPATLGEEAEAEVDVLHDLEEDWRNQ